MFGLWSLADVGMAVWYGVVDMMPKISIVKKDFILQYALQYLIKAAPLMFFKNLMYADISASIHFS